MAGSAGRAEDGRRGAGVRRGRTGAGRPGASDQSRSEQVRGVPAASAFTAAASTAGVGFDHPARQHRTIWVEPLTGDFQAEHMEAGERGQVRASEGSVGHVEVFQMRRVGTPIFGRPRPSLGDRRADPLYPLNYEQPRVVSTRQRRPGAIRGIGPARPRHLEMRASMPSSRKSRPVRKVWLASRLAPSRTTVASAGNRPVAKVRSR